MKNNKTWITLVEVMVAVFILAIALSSVFSMHKFALQEEIEIKEKIYFNNYNAYIYWLVKGLDIPVYSVWNEFYIKEVSDSNFDFDSSVAFESDKLGFFDTDFPLSYSHKLKFLWSTTINTNTYNTYEITVKLWNLEKAYLMTK